MRQVTPGRLDFTIGLDPLEEELHFLLGSSVLQPPKPMRGSEWIEKYGRISSDTSGQPGKVTLWGYQREPADIICGNGHDQVTVMNGTRVGYFNLIKQCVAVNLVQADRPEERTGPDRRRGAEVALFDVCRPRRSARGSTAS